MEWCRNVDGYVYLRPPTELTYRVAMTRIMLSCSISDRALLMLSLTMPFLERLANDETNESLAEAIPSHANYRCDRDG